MEQTKRCAGCGETKPVSDFHKQAGAPGGYRPRCKVCRKSETEAWYVANRDTIKARTKRWQEEHREEYLAYLKDWSAKNKDRKREMDRRHKADQRAHYKEYENRPEVRSRARQNAKNQKARRKLQMGASHHPITAAEWEELKQKNHYRCVYCDVMETTEEPLTQDHVVSLKKGGSHTLDNILPACGLCNRTKQTMSLAEFMLYRKLHKEM